MNHDRIIEKLTTANEKLDMFKEIAELHGMDDTQLLDALFNQYFENVADRDGIEPTQAKQKYEQSKQAKTQKMLDKFVSEFKDVKPEDIPDEVWNAVKNGEDLTSAYKSHITQNTLKTKDSEMAELKSKIETLEKQLKVKEQNESTKKKAVVKPVNSLEEKEDDFLSGLFGQKENNMAVNLAKKYAKEIDQLYTLGSLTKAAFGMKYDFIGVKTVAVYTLTSQALVDYTRTGANRYGSPAELQDTNN